jgi:flavin reductase (DIM6/NTAB) family NADH-FMN oxidoreductase RutF
MRKNFGAKTWLYPMPVLIIATYDENGTPNAMNAAWGGIFDDDKIAVCIDISHKTAANVQLHKAFTVSIGDAGHTTACDYVVIVSGNDDPGKFTKAGFHAVKSSFVDAPLIEELPMTLECELVSFDQKTGCTVARIINVSADEKILGDDGKIDPGKLEPITYDPVHHKYLKLGAIAGNAFKDGLQLK